MERTLHAALLANPRLPVSTSDIDAIADADARENWKLLVSFRDHLLHHKTLEAAYIGNLHRGLGAITPLFIHELMHVIFLNALNGVGYPRVLRAAGSFLPHATRHLA